MRCDVIAQGIINAVKAVSLPVPLVVRLEGTNVALGKKLLEESKLPIQAASDLAEAAGELSRKRKPVNPTEHESRRTSIYRVPVTDMKRARAFYEGVLKLEPTRTFENPKGHWIEYDLGSSTFAISNMSKEEWKSSSDGPAVAFEVDDFDSAMGDLRASDVRFVLEPFESPSLSNGDYRGSGWEFRLHP